LALAKAEGGILIKGKTVRKLLLLCEVIALIVPVTVVIVPLTTGQTVGIWLMFWWSIRAPAVVFSSMIWSILVLVYVRKAKPSSEASKIRLQKTKRKLYVMIGLCINAISFAAFFAIALSLEYFRDRKFIVAGVLRLAEEQGALLLFVLFGFTNSVVAHNEQRKTSSGSHNNNNNNMENKKTNSGSLGPRSPTTPKIDTHSHDDGTVKITPSNGELNAILNNGSTGGEMV